MSEREVLDISSDFENDRTVVTTIERGPNGGKVVDTFDAPFDPYCFIEKGDLSMNHCRLSGVRPSPNAPEGYARIEADTFWDLRDFDDRVVYDTYEADTEHASDVLIDEGWSVATPRPDEVLYFDIETDDRGEFTEAEDADTRILSIGAVDGDGRKFYWDDDYERELLRRFLKTADDYAVIVGWNAIGFDFPYVDNRCLANGIDVDWSRWVRLDLMPLYDTLGRPTETLSLKLDDTAERELGEGAGKTDVKPGSGRLYDMWKSGDKRLKKYNIRDAEIVKELDEEFGLVELLHTICDICGYPPGETCYEDKYGNVKLAIGMVVDAKILSVARKRGQPMFNRGKYSDTGEFPGGDVLDPTPGMHRDVVTVDYSGMYPSIIRAFNLGPRTWAENAADLNVDAFRIIRGESGVFVDETVQKSILAEAAEDLDKIRQESKSARNEAPTGSREYEIANQRDKGVKVANNTIFGVVASPYHRYYLPGASENITLIGQKLVRIAERVSNEHGSIRRVLYGDTDSVMVELDTGAVPEDLDGKVSAAHEVADAIEAEIQRWATVERNANGSLLELDVDYVWDKFHQTDKKKRYFGRVVYDGGDRVDEVKYKGIEARQNDVPKPCRELQKELMHAVCYDEPTGPIVDKYKDRLFAGEVDADMATNKGLGKSVSAYKAATPPLHVRAATAIREEFGRGEVHVGDKVGYIKFGHNTNDWTWVHNGEMGRALNHVHYSYLWDEKFCTVMESIGVEPDSREQTGLDAFAAADD